MLLRRPTMKRKCRVAPSELASSGNHHEIVFFAGEDVTDKMSNQKESAAGETKAKVANSASSLPKAVPSSKKAAIVDKVKANEQRRSKALALKRANYERLIEAMAWDEKHVLTTCEESTVKDTADPDPKVDCPILNTRLALLGYAKAIAINLTKSGVPSTVQ